jgi:hypothetical protein
MITEFELQTRAGQLWIDIKEHLDAKDAEIVKAGAAQPRLAKLFAAVTTAFAAGDFDECKSLLFPAIEEERLTEKERRLAEIDKRISDAQAERAKVEAEEIKVDAVK